MAIYPDKKNGKLTGRFRVELQRGGERYRKRWDTYAEAEGDEMAVQAAWAAGEATPAPGEAPGAPTVHTFDSVIPLAKGTLWDGKSTEDTCWAHIEWCANLLCRKTRLDAVDTHSIDRVVKALKAEKKAAGTINRYLSHLRTFLMWSKSRKYRTLPVAGDDGITFDWQDEAEGRIRWITFEEEKQLEAFLVHTEREDPDHAAAAAAVWDLIDIAIETGCRRDEMLTAELAQINGLRLHLWETKTDTPRTVPLTQRVRDKLVSLIAQGRMPTRRGLRSWWNRARVHMGLENDDDFVFHACRHTCATRQVDAGVNVFVIKEWMGHKRIETTLRYAHVKPQNLEDALVRVGDYRRAANENSQISAENSLPTLHPTGVGMGVNLQPTGMAA
ncbi:tyrosine-type recombinase/integrase [Sphingomonas asaccharolytica]|uniref:tyrosine-type recombinase/integrase n=1 Tax=Sphingomonas asaccharolytica TaxID=40681 RepID=UPI0008379937|nr:site-specific integrase [Sphingomonas asaccharolytica]